MEGYEERSLRGKVFERLREDILSGVYKEKEELREASIGEEMGVSRTPVREALRQLELEGLVRIIPNKGAYVTGITQADVRDIYKIRSMLEGLCARWATRHITEAQMTELEEIILLSEFHIKITDRRYNGNKIGDQRHTLINRLTCRIFIKRGQQSCKGGRARVQI